jgi:hypothetical protein
MSHEHRIFNSAICGDENESYLVVPLAMEGWDRGSILDTCKDFSLRRRI